MSKRYKHILVPLDGSKLAEQALDDAFGLAELSQADVTLLQVVIPIDHVVVASTGYPVYIEEQLDYNRASALTYLKEVKGRWQQSGVQINLMVDTGPAAEMILDYANQERTDLIVMATHGRSGVSRWVYGSVAEKVLRAANVPVLLVRAERAEPQGSAEATK